MRNKLSGLTILVLFLGCSENTNINNPDSGVTETVVEDTGSATIADSEENTSGSDTAEDTDSEEYGPCSCSQPNQPYCSDFPEPNEPDECRRILLDKRSNGQAFYYGASDPQLSRDGNFAVFTQTISEDLSCQEESRIENDNNTVRDVYLVNLQTFEMELVSVSNEGAPGDQGSYSPSISEDGRFIAFVSDAKNLISTPPNFKGIYVRDREKGTTEVVSVSNSGASANGSCSFPLISADGRFVLFETMANNLVPGDFNGKGDLFLRDRELEYTERISIGEDGAEADDHATEALGISADGRFVLFRHVSNLSPQDDDTEETGSATHRVDIYLRDRNTGRNWMPGVSSDGEHSRHGALMLSDDGKSILLHKSPKAFGIDMPEGRQTLNTIATLEQDGFKYRAILPSLPVDNALDWIVAVDEKMNIIAMNSCYSFEKLSSDKRPDSYSVANACSVDIEGEKISMITSSESGRPGVNTAYDYSAFDEARMTDYVELSNFSADGKRILFSTVLYGIVENSGVCCRNTQRHIYLRDCR